MVPVNTEPQSSLTEVVAFFRMDGGDLPLSEVKDLTDQDRLDLRHMLDAYKACSDHLA